MDSHCYTRVPLPTPTVRKMSQIFRYSFTWHTNVLNRERLEEVLKALCTKYIFQYERGEESGKEHFQGRFTLQRKTRLLQLAKRFQTTYNCAGLHLIPEADEIGSTRYSGKCDTRIEGPWQWPQEVSYLGQDIPAYDRLYDWQQEIVDYVVGPVENNREILWLVDKHGCSGKSTVCKYLAFHHQASCHGWQDTKHTLHAVVTEGPKKIYMFDLTRAKPSDIGQNDLYSALESIKNGHVRSPMYDAKSLMMTSPHVVVFANHPPLRDNLSRDRLTVLDVPTPPVDIAPALKRFRWSTSAPARADPAGDT